MASIHASEREETPAVRVTAIEGLNPMSRTSTVIRPGTIGRTRTAAFLVSIAMNTKWPA